MALKGSRGRLMLRYKREAVRLSPANSSSKELLPIELQKSSESVSPFLVVS